MKKMNKISIIKLASLIILGSCCQKEGAEYSVRDKIYILIPKQSEYITKTNVPDENLISNINILAFNEDGELTNSKYIKDRELQSSERGIVCDLEVFRAQKTDIVVCCNFGYRIQGIITMEELRKYRYGIQYPDEFHRGIPMVGFLKEVQPGEGELTVEMERLMSKISIRIDRRKLSKNTKLNISGITVGNSPKSVAILGNSKAENKSDVFKTGYSLDYPEADLLNTDNSPGVSEDLTLYVLENMQGDLLKGNKEQKKRLPENINEFSEVCSYIELKIEYQSDTLISSPNDYLIYRFYLGESNENFDVRRNCHYHFTITPEGSGLSETSWRVYKTGLAKKGEAKMKVFPGNYIEGKVGESIEVWAELEPPDGAFNIGIEELEFDKERGIYDYEIVKNGRGVKLKLKSRGSGILYFSAGYPVSDAAAIGITVN